jgi:hypothetical protein
MTNLENIQDKVRERIGTDEKYVEASLKLQKVFLSTPSVGEILRLGTRPSNPPRSSSLLIDKLRRRLLGSPAAVASWCTLDRVRGSIELYARRTPDIHDLARTRQVDDLVVKTDLDMKHILLEKDTMTDGQKRATKKAIVGTICTFHCATAWKICRGS